MACFSCGENKNLDTISLLQFYKDAYEKTGNVFWFFKHVDNAEIKIMCNEDFKTFKKANKIEFSSGQYEFSRIDEFRLT
jgi:hypothetical protein